MAKDPIIDKIIDYYHSHELTNADKEKLGQILIPILDNEYSPDALDSLIDSESLDIFLRKDSLNDMVLTKQQVAELANYTLSLGDNPVLPAEIANEVLNRFAANYQANTEETNVDVIDIINKYLLSEKLDLAQKKNLYTILVSAVNPTIVIDDGFRQHLEQIDTEEGMSFYIHDGFVSYENRSPEGHKYYEDPATINDIRERIINLPAEKLQQIPTELLQQILLAGQLSQVQNKIQAENQTETLSDIEVPTAFTQEESTEENIEENTKENTDEVKEWGAGDATFEMPEIPDAFWDAMMTVPGYGEDSVAMEIPEELNTSVNPDDRQLLIKFYKLFTSNTQEAALYSIMCEPTILSCVDRNFNPRKFPNYTALNNHFKDLLENTEITDETLVRGLLKLSDKELATITPNFWADIYKSDACKKLNITDRNRLEKKVKTFLPYNDMSEANEIYTAYYEQDVKDIIDNSLLARSPDAAQIAKDTVTQKGEDFDNTFDKDFVERLAKGETPFYGITGAPNLDRGFTARMRCQQMFGKEAGNTYADAFQAYRNLPKDKKEQNINEFAGNAALNTMLETLAKRKGVTLDSKDLLPEAVATPNGKNAPKPFVSQVIGTFLNTTKTSAIASTVTGVCMPLIQRIPVIGDYASLAIGAGTVGVNLIKQIRAALQTAQARDPESRGLKVLKNLKPREIANIVINTATASAPYALMLAKNTNLGRGVSAGLTFGKTLVLDLINKKAGMEPLNAKEVLKSIGLSAAKALGMVAGGQIGRFVLNEFTDASTQSKASAAATQKNDEDFSEYEKLPPEQQGPKGKFQTDMEEIDAKLEELDVRIAREEFMKENEYGPRIQRPMTEAEAQYVEENSLDENPQFRVEPNRENTAVETAGDTTVASGTDTDTGITASTKKLTELKENPWKLTANAESTANPDNQRQWQLNSNSGKWERMEWYSKTDFDNAMETLHNAGLDDHEAMCAIRNLTGAIRWRGANSSYATAWENLKNGIITNTEVDQILQADAILDETGALIVDQPAVEVPQEETIPAEEDFVEEQFIDDNLEEPIEVEQLDDIPQQAEAPEHFGDEPINEPIEEQLVVDTTEVPDHFGNEPVVEPINEQFIDTTDVPDHFGNQNAAEPKEKQVLDSMPEHVGVQENEINTQENSYDSNMPEHVGNQEPDYEEDNSMPTHEEPVVKSKRELRAEQRAAKAEAKAAAKAERAAAREQAKMPSHIGNKKTRLNDIGDTEAALKDQAPELEPDAVEENATESSMNPAGHAWESEPLSFSQSSTTDSSQTIMDNAQANLDKWEHLNAVKKGRILDVVSRACRDLDRNTARILDKGLAQTEPEARAAAYKEFLETNSDELDFWNDNYYKYAGFNPTENYNRLCQENGFNPDNLQTFWGTVDNDPALAYAEPDKAKQMFDLIGQHEL